MSSLAARGGECCRCFHRKTVSVTTKVSYIRKRIRFLEIALIVSKSDCRALVSLGLGIYLVGLELLSIIG
jgi:hypothetical protein